MKKIYIIDGNSFIYRMFFALPEFTTKDGQVVNALFGMAKFFVNTLIAQNPDYLIFIKDAKGKNFRHELYEEYKATRAKMPDNLISQISLIEEMIKLMNIEIVEIPGFEADDVIGTLATSLGKDTNFEIDILTGDKDLHSLVSKNVFIYDMMKKKKFGPEETLEKFGVKPEFIIDYLAIVGDSSDNIPGINKFGPKKAVDLINAIGGVEKIFEEVEKVGLCHSTLVSNSHPNPLSTERGKNLSPSVRGKADEVSKGESGSGNVVKDDGRFSVLASQAQEGHDGQCCGYFKDSVSSTEGHNSNCIENLPQNIQPYFRGNTFEMLKNSKEIAFLSKQLASIKLDVPLENFSIENFKFSKQDILNKNVLAFFEKYEFNSLVGDEIEAKLQSWKDLGLKVHIVDNDEDLEKLRELIINSHPNPLSTERGNNSFIPPQLRGKDDEVSKGEFGGGNIVKDAENNDYGYFKDSASSAEGHNYIVLDTETTSLNIMEAELVGISVYIDDENIYYINRWHSISVSSATLTNHSLNNPGNKVSFLALQKFVRNILNSNILIIGHNLKYDLEVLEMFLRKTEDTFIPTSIKENVESKLPENKKENSQQTSLF